VFKRALVIINRNGKADFDRDADIARLHGSGVGVVEEHADRPQQILGLIARWQEQIDCIIFGDALWLRAAAPALVARHLPFGLLPARTQSRSNLSATVVADNDIDMIKAVRTGMLQGIDVGMVNGHYFFRGASIVQDRAKKKAFHAEIVCDGRSRHLRSTGIAIGVGRYIDVKPIPEADGIDHHQLFLSSRAPLRWVDRFKPAPVTGRCGEVDITQARHVQIITDEAMTIVADGEAVTRTPATFTLLPQAIAALAPVSFAE